MKWLVVLFGKSSNKVCTSTTTASEYFVFGKSVKVSPTESEEIFVAAKLSVFRKLDDEPLPQQASRDAAVSRAEKVFSLDTTVESSLDASSQVDRQGDSSSVKLDAEHRLLRTRLAEHRLLRMQFLRQTRGKHRL